MLELLNLQELPASQLLESTKTKELLSSRGQELSKNLLNLVETMLLPPDTSPSFEEILQLLQIYS
jgi:hypothetical protein